MLLVLVRAIVEVLLLARTRDLLLGALVQGILAGIALKG